MTKISCSIIQDLLPLYCDDVCSSDSKKMIEEHLQECAACSDLLRQLKCEYRANTPEIAENKAKNAVLEKLSHGWKHSILKAAVKALLIGIISTTIVLSIVYGVHSFLFVGNIDMVVPEQVSVSLYNDTKMPGEHITIKMQPFDGYCGGTMDAYVDVDGNLYISILRKVVKERIPDGENEVMGYGFDQAEKNYTAVYYGKPDNCKLLWKPGDILPETPADLFQFEEK